MKISDLKKGDKIYCIKTLTSTRKIKRDPKYYERLNYFNNTDWTELTEDERAEHNNFDFRKEEEYDFLMKDKFYTVKSKFYNEIEISTEVDDTLMLSNSILCSYNDSFLNEYFISEIEARKYKLEELSDNNFKSFLKNLKK